MSQQAGKKDAKECRGEAMTQPCLTPLRISNGGEVDPSYCTVPFMPPWNDRIMLSSFGGQPTFAKTVNRPSISVDQVKSLCQIDES